VKSEAPETAAKPRQWQQSGKRLAFFRPAAGGRALWDAEIDVSGATGAGGREPGGTTGEWWPATEACYL